ncbi:kinetochore Sim4 complex subunit FTA2-domain-containing protein [Nemania sp. FL0916]|nr:kinetochore Sim4 complex subunit FTA2-domain-containing protein [Nemania sp. FL0916]
MPKRASRMLMATQPPALPTCPGPKLAPFQGQNAKIKWIERLDLDRDGESSTQACVYKVEIGSKIYALKIFKFFDPNSVRYYWEDELDDSFPLNEIIFYTDPFFAECRAYGRIKEARVTKRVREKLVVPCHGYLFLNKKDEMWLKRDGVDLGSKHLSKEYHPTLVDPTLVRAIVKDFEPRPSGLTSKNVRQALRRVKRLNEIGIYNGDVRGDNFRGGYLVDFGTAQTEPHCLLDILDEDDLGAKKEEDMVMFDEAVIEDEVKTRARALVHRRRQPSRKGKR